MKKTEDRQIKYTGRTEQVEDSGEQERRYRHRIYTRNVQNFSATSNLQNFKKTLRH